MPIPFLAFWENSFVDKENVGKLSCKIRVQLKQSFLQLELKQTQEVIFFRKIKKPINCRSKSCDIELVTMPGHYGWLRIKHKSKT